MLADGAGDGANMLQIGGAILVGRRTDCDELKQPVHDAFSDVGSELQPAAGAVAPNHLIQTGFVNRNLATLQHRHFALIHIHTQHIVAHFGEAGPSHQPDIAGAKNGNFHR